jgi:PAS domain S-box-containing protein
VTPEVLTRFAAVFPDPMLVLSLDGLVLAANAAAQRVFGGATSPVGRRLAEIVVDPPERIEPLLARWARTPTLSLGALAARGPGDRPIALRVDGARIPPDSPGAAPMILVWCRLKSDEETTSRFLALNERILALGREIAERKRVELELREQREWLQVTLGSIGDAVITTDGDGRVTFMNAVAQELTGWAADEAMGKPVTGLIRLVNEQTRQPADDPIARVLHDGRTVGLANHTLLIDRHGREHSIDDSAAPIRGNGGPVIGVVVVFHDVSERQRLQREIARQLAELAEADRRKDEFLAMLGHELRNPLAAMVNAMAVRRTSGPDDPSRERALHVVERQLVIMERLVDDLLDVARIRRGAIELRRERVDLRLVVARAVETARPTFAERGLRLIVTQAPESLRIHADPVRIEQVVANLLNNALKYTPRGGRVEVVTAGEDADAAVTVRDTGTGIDPALLPSIFDLFVQGRLPLHRPEGGLGIGLTLVRRVVEMHGGEVRVSSAGLGQGSTFSVTLPRLAEPLASGTTPEVAVASGRLMRVLVVDDHEDSADMLAVFLSSSGHDVEVAHDGPTALAAAIRFRPRLVLLDIGLPGMDGYAVAKALRAIGDLAPLTIVALTGYGQPEDRDRSREAGFDLHVVKPISPEKLQEMIAGIG